jgi:hypothetical protein
MQFERCVRNMEIGQAFEYLFSLFHKYLMIIQRAQTHVVLSKEEFKKEVFNRFARAE